MPAHGKHEAQARHQAGGRHRPRPDGGLLRLDHLDLKKHVPWSEAGPTAVLLGAAYCGACLAGVFWMALNLFRVTLADQMLPKTAGSKDAA